MNQKVTITKSHEVEMVTCEHCHMEFVLYAAVGEEEGRWLLSQVDEGEMYCPYCGKNTKKD